MHTGLFLLTMDTVSWYLLYKFEANSLLSMQRWFWILPTKFMNTIILQQALFILKHCSTLSDNGPTTTRTEQNAITAELLLCQTLAVNLVITYNWCLPVHFFHGLVLTYMYQHIYCNSSLFSLVHTWSCQCIPYRPCRNFPSFIHHILCTVHLGSLVIYWLFRIK
jgi:hypothetical protein